MAAALPLLAVSSLTSAWAPAAKGGTTVFGAKLVAAAADVDRPAID